MSPIGHTGNEHQDTKLGQGDLRLWDTVLRLQTRLEEAFLIVRSRDSGQIIALPAFIRGYAHIGIMHCVSGVENMRCA